MDLFNIALGEEITALPPDYESLNVGGNSRKERKRTCHNSVIEDPTPARPHLLVLALRHKPLKNETDP